MRSGSLVVKLLIICAGCFATMAFAQDSSARIVVESPREIATSLSEKNAKLAAEEAKLLSALQGQKLEVSDKKPESPTKELLQEMNKPGKPELDQEQEQAPPKVEIRKQSEERASLKLVSPEQEKKAEEKKPLKAKEKEKSTKTEAAAKSKASSITSELLGSIQKTSMELADKLREREERISQLQRELDEARQRLIVAETEKERLAKQLETRNLSSLGAYATQAQPKRVTEVQLPPGAGKTHAPAVEADLPVVTVVADKAALRTGPGPDNSPLMDVTKGTTLTVETRSGNWYRVNTPTGTRAWISADVVRFGAAQPDSNIRVGGFDPSVEEQAFKLLKNREK